MFYSILKVVYKNVPKIGGKGDNTFMRCLTLRFGVKPGSGEAVLASKLTVDKNCLQKDNRPWKEEHTLKRLGFGTLNILTLTNKLDELVDVMKKRKLDMSGKRVDRTWRKKINRYV